MQQYDQAHEAIEVLFYFYSEKLYSATKRRLDKIGAIVIDLAPHLIEARLPEADIAGIVRAGGDAYTRKTGIPQSVLESMLPEVRAYAQAFSSLQRFKCTPHEGIPWNADGFDTP